MLPKVSLVSIGVHKKVLDWVAKYKPVSIIIVNERGEGRPERPWENNEIDMLRAAMGASPQTLFIFRSWPDGIGENIPNWALWDRLVECFKPFRDMPNPFMAHGYNEPGFPWIQASGDARKLASAEIGFAQTMHDAGLLSMNFCFSESHLLKGNMGLWEIYAEALPYVDALGFNEYDWPYWDSSRDQGYKWRIGHYEHQLLEIRKHFSNMPPVIIGEGILDGKIQYPNPYGWQKKPYSPRRYVEYHQAVYDDTYHNPEVFSHHTFCYCGPESEWRSYSIEPILDDLGKLIQGQIYWENYQDAPRPAPEPSSPQPEPGPSPDLPHESHDPRGWSSNGIGMHFTLQPTADMVERGIEWLKSIRATITVICAEDDALGMWALKRCSEEGITPIWRKYVPIHSKENFNKQAQMALANGCQLVIVVNECMDDRDNPQHKPIEFCIEKTFNRASAVIAAGALPGIQFLAPEELALFIDYASGQGATYDNFWRFVWFAHHGYHLYSVDGYKEPPDATPGGGRCFLGFLDFAKVFEEKLGFVPPIIITELSYQTPNAPADWWLPFYTCYRDGVLPNGEPLPDYLIATCPWIMAGGAMGLFKGLLDYFHVVKAFQEIPPFDRREEKKMEDWEKIWENVPDRIKQWRLIIAEAVRGKPANAISDYNGVHVTPTRVIACIIEVESGGNPGAVGGAGVAHGLMQIWKDHYPSQNLFDPKINITIGLNILETKLGIARGNLCDALYYYSGGTAWASVAGYKENYWSRFVKSYKDFWRDNLEPSSNPTEDILKRVRSLKATEIASHEAKMKDIEAIEKKAEEWES